MARYSKQAPRPSGQPGAGPRGDYYPPPPYSKTPKSSQPPLNSGPRHSERTPLLASRERIVTRETHTRETRARETRTRETRTRETWTVPGHQRSGGGEESSPNPPPPCAGLYFVGGLLLLLTLGWFLLHYEIFSFWPGPPRHWPSPPRYSVAIIGAGPAGISAAQHLRTSPGAGGVVFDVTVFESGSSVGGKLAFFDSEGGRVFPYNDSTLDPISAEDIAGPALMWSNTLFTQSFEGILGDEVEFFDLPSQKVGYYSAYWQIFVQTTRPYSETPFLDWVGLIFRYGSSVWQAGHMLGEAYLRDSIKDAPISPDVPKLLSFLGLTGLAQERAADTLNSRRVSDAYRSELTAPQVERGANLRLPAMSGLSMIMAAAQEDLAYKHAGGDFVESIGRIARGLPGVNVQTHSKVTGINRGSLDEIKAAWFVRHEGFGHTEVEAFDRVIIAAPGLEQQRVHSPFGTHAVVEIDADNDGEDDDENVIEEAVEFDPVYVTLFTTSEPLRNPIPGAQKIWVPPQVLFADYVGGIHEATYVRELVRRGDDGSRRVEHLYRYVSEQDISDLLSSDPTVTWVHHRRLDDAYPLTYPRTRYPSFRLGDGLWTTNPIYSIGSTVDLSWLAGRIAAQQVIDTVKGKGKA